MICFAMVAGMTLFLLVAGVLLESSDGVGLAEEPIESLDTLCMLLGAAMTVGAISSRVILGRRAASLEQPMRSRVQTSSRIIPIAMLEGACLLATVTWLLNGTAVPALVVACVMLSLAIAMVPIRAPDAETLSDQ